MEELVNNEPVIKPEEVDTDATTATEVVATEATEQVQPVEQPTKVAEAEPEVKAEPKAEAELEVETEPEAEAEPVAELQIPDTKEGIIERLKEIAQGEEEINRQEVDALKSHFYRILKTEGEAAYKQYVDDGGAPEAYTPIIDPLEQLFKEEMNIVREKRAAQHKALEQQKEQNYLRKLQIIEKIKVILDNPDEVNKSYNEFRALQTEWNGMGILFNLIPGIRWLHLRELVEAKVAYGYLSNKPSGTTGTTGHSVYAEVGVGIGNILRVCDLYSVWGFLPVTNNPTPTSSYYWGMRFRIHLGL